MELQATMKQGAMWCMLQVGFHDQKNVRHCKVEKKVNEIINRLEKTRQERNPDLAAEKQVCVDWAVRCSPSSG
jgi:hypothetical protein